MISFILQLINMLVPPILVALVFLLPTKRLSRRVSLEKMHKPIELEAIVVGVNTSYMQLLKFQYAVIIVKDCFVDKPIRLVTHQWAEPFIDLDIDSLPKMKVIYSTSNGYEPQVSEWLLSVSETIFNK